MLINFGQSVCLEWQKILPFSWRELPALIIPSFLPFAMLLANAGLKQVLFPRDIVKTLLCENWQSQTNNEVSTVHEILFNMSM